MHVKGFIRITSVIIQCIIIIITTEHEFECDWFILSTVTCPVIKIICTFIKPGYCDFFPFFQHLKF